MAVTLDFDLYRNTVTGFLESGVVFAEIVGDTLTMRGEGFGAGATIAIWQSWMNKTVGSREVKGDWTSGVYGHNNVDDYPLIYQIGDVTGFGSRDPSNARPDNLVGFVKTVAPFKDYFYMWQMGVPDGYYFSGASAGRTNPPASNLKMGWCSDQGLDDSALADIVSMSRNAPTAWSVVGNQTPVSMYVASAFDWDKRNSFMTTHIAGTSPFLDNGTVIGSVTTSSGTTTVSTTSSPLFQQIFKFIPAIQASTLYSVTIDGTLCQITSSASPTIDNIVTALIAEIATKGLTGITAAKIDTNSDGVAEGLALNCALGTQHTATGSANLTKTELLPQFDRLSTNWQGNNNQTNTMHVFPMCAFATGTNCGNWIVFTTSDTFNGAGNTDTIAVKHTAWSDSEITIDLSEIPSYVLSVYTHWHRLLNGVSVQHGVLP